jgi:acetyltransferase
VDINKIILKGNMACIVDSMVIPTQSQVTLPEHSDGGAYPSHYEKRITTKTGLKLFIRPIKPGDASLLLGLFNSLSLKTKYYRFFSPLKILPKDMLARFTQIDYSKDMALVAFGLPGSDEKIIAVARFMNDPGGTDHQFAIVVGDEWQGKGVGRVLMENLIMIAKERKIKMMKGIVLAENRHMLALARKLGFSLSKIPGENQYDLKIDLGSVDID